MKMGENKFAPSWSIVSAFQVYVVALKGGTNDKKVREKEWISAISALIYVASLMNCNVNECVAIAWNKKYQSRISNKLFVTETKNIVKRHK